MESFENLLNLFGRIAISALFLPSGLIKLLDVEGTTNYFYSLGVPIASFIVWLAIVIEIVGALMLILGYKTRIVALGLAILTLGTNFFGHAFWAAPADATFIVLLFFFKNIAVVGGLLVLASSGSGSISLDSYFKRLRG